jgi:biotin carboxyl carrier protein
MRLTAELDGEQHSINLKRDGARLTASVGDREYELEVREQGAGVYLLLLGHRVFECRVDWTNNTRDRVEVYLGGESYEVSLADPKRMRGARGAGAHADGTAHLASPMPGKVVRVLVEQGAMVEAGQSILVVEAMKMQNEMKSPRAGTVKELHATPGATVNAGEVLAIIE